MREAKARADAIKQGLVHITPGERGSLMVQENKRRTTPLEIEREQKRKKLEAENLRKQKMQNAYQLIDGLPMKENDDPDGGAKLA
jgi:hypothetical protein